MRTSILSKRTEVKSMFVLFCNGYRSLFIAILITSAIILPGTVQAEEQVINKNVEVVGTGIIYENNTAIARERAITNSLVSAIEKVMGELLPFKSLVKNFNIINNVFYENTGEYVQGYKVLAEVASDKLFSVMVQATVSTERIKERLLNIGIAVGGKTLPKILFFIAEKSFEDILPKYWWGEELSFSKAFAESAMEEKFNEAGFSIIDHGHKVQNMVAEFGSNKPDITIQEAVSLGVHLQADVVIIGKSIAKTTPNVMEGNLKSFKGIIKIRAIWTDTGEEFAFSTKNAVTVNSDEIAGGNEALSMVGSLAGEELISQIAVAWYKKTEKPVMIEIIIKGTDNLSNFVMFRRMLNEMPEIKDVQIREMKSDEAIIGVDFKGNSKELADDLMTKAFDSFGINIYNISPTSLEIELIPG